MSEKVKMKGGTNYFGKVGGHEALSDHGDNIVMV
jgi:hypothetical protein